MQDRLVNQNISSSGKDFYTKGVTGLYNNPTEEFNVNNGFLLSIYFNMEEWRILWIYGISGMKECPDFYQKAMDILDSMLDFLAAKIPDAEELMFTEDMKGISNDCRGIFINKSNGQQMINRKLKYDVEYKLKRQYRKIMRRMQEIGILTKVAKDPSLSMADIE